MTRFERLMKAKRPVAFRKPIGCIGLFEGGSDGWIFIAIKPRKLSPAQVYLHELLHVVYPAWPERKVLRYERSIWRKLTVYQRFRLYRKLFSRPFRSRKDDDC